ncbi:MAG: hypothetical protein JWN33_120 [Candidatus Saccharibacteria bacterium]|nr:hypothetical protein [Candidatus Saccharibacteria bacterium]
MNNYVKFGIAILLFLIGSSLVIGAFESTGTLWRLIPGIILIGLAYPWGHMLWARLQSGYRQKTDEEILAEARAAIRRSDGGKSEEK